jgi:hypothetical protein
VVSTISIVLVACGGVDRDGSRDDIVDAMRNQGLEADVECVDHVIGGYSDSELEDIDDELRRPAITDTQTLQFLDALRGCGTTTTTTAPP